MRLARPRKLRRYGLIFLLALMLGQGGLLVHDVTAEHSAAEVCDICASLDRPAATPFIGGTISIALGASILILYATTGLGSRRILRAHPSRAPPAL
jgi:hypothetical protein